MEGSATLHHWSRLATPHLGTLLEERPGVTTRETDSNGSLKYSRDFLGKQTSAWFITGISLKNLLLNLQTNCVK